MQQNSHNTNDVQRLAAGMYRPEFERENCGFGLIAHMDGEPSHRLVQTAIQALARMTHRGGISSDGKTGDGCGLLLQKPDSFLRKAAQGTGIELAEHYGVGVLFLDTDTAKAAAARQQVELAVQAEDLVVAGWREVPIDTSGCGEHALKTLPQIEHIFINAPDGLDAEAFERKLFFARRRAEKAILAAGDQDFFIPSFSSQVISYKGLVMPEYLPIVYKDLGDPELESAICVFHQRFSTNTLPQWRLAQPFRYLAHNGEINTVWGNRNWSVARTHKFQSDQLPDVSVIAPLVNREGSDSSSLDNMLEVLLTGGLSIFHAMRLLVPPAWQNVETMDPDLRAFYEYNSMHMEPWDGPAGIVLTDGRYAACCLDRNGLRPARYVITKDRLITLASEVGVYDYAPEDVVEKGRLGPGQMLAVDTQTGSIIANDAIDQQLKQRHPYKRWLRDYGHRIESTLTEEEEGYQPIDVATLGAMQKLYQLTFEERDQVLRVLAESGQEAVGSMGDDTPMAVLSQGERSVYDYFRQQFAQVTNPPIDPLREAIVMSLETCLGPELSIFEETAEHAERVLLDSPILSPNKFTKLCALEHARYRHTVLDLNYEASEGLQTAIQRICQAAEASVREGVSVLVLSDQAISRDKLPIHAALATGAVHHHLTRQGLRCDANLVIETATARNPHEFAVLIGYGATAVYPYLAYHVIEDMRRLGQIGADQGDAIRNYGKGIEKGLLKILSKMGISTIASYRGAQLFEAVGLHDEVVDLCFVDTISRVQGARFAEIEKDQQRLAKEAWNLRKPLRQGGLLKYVHNGEYHAYNPDVVQTLHVAVRSGDYQDYQRYADLVNNRSVATFRDLLQVKTGENAIELDQVEPLEDIYKRFDSAGMSLGALSPEAHEALAIAMNHLGARSNSGEGGEDPARYGNERVSKIKQIASGRFGVTPHYLVNAEVLQIKVAQGAKPGEGGQLPGHKVNGLIARLRHSVPGVTLISPPPHHDIYSIEDLAQLIFDLKQVNPDALVSVKLVSKPGVGTIAAGVAKAYADLITISGYDGGTAASPLTSVRYAGSPWELGLTETHQVLQAMDLRDKVRLQADGGMKTGLDVIKAAILGAESFGFGTAPMVALGCKYLRICHLNNCATGVATQNDDLRDKHFIGLPEMVINYFTFVAKEVRQWLAALGVPRLEDLIGRTDLLAILEGDTAKQQHLDLQPILHQPYGYDEKPRYCSRLNPPYDPATLNQQIVEQALQAVEDKTGGSFSFPILNTDRSVGARLSGEIAKRHGNHGMDDTPVVLNFTGTAGQSFGVWNAGGLHLILEGDANDYVGKGMAGGKLVLKTPAQAQYASNVTPIMGNTCLYGATGGRLFASGVAGERFAVRNSGVHAVLEGAGDHCCEYMTGGVVTILGPTGHNFGAGMTGGFAYVLDQENTFVDKYNHELIDIHRISIENMEAHRYHLRQIIEEFVTETGSQWGQQILDDFEDFVTRFWLVKPKAAELDRLMDNLRTHNE